MAFASIQIKDYKAGTSTDENGNFSITINPNKIEGDSLTVLITFIGYRTISQTIYKNEDKTLNVKLKSEEQTLNTVEVVEEQTQQQKELESTQMGAIRMPIKQIMRLPSIGGEVDIVRVMQLLPGVSGGIEGTTGMFVRGGTDDQNLVLIDKASVYEFSHLFGFFSIFNPDAVQDFNLIKGAFPAKYGGRLSSILEIDKKEGDSKKIHGAGGIGLLSSRITIEGPIIKDKLTFSVSARRTYIDQVAKLAKLIIPYYFYDLSGKVGYKINENNSIYLSTYFGKDVLYADENTGGGMGGSKDTSNTNGQFGFTKQNLASSIGWRHNFSDQLYSEITFINTFFNYAIDGQFADNSIKAKSKVRDIGLRNDFKYRLNTQHLISFGGEFTQHNFQPNLVTTQGDISEFLESQSAPELGFQEIGLYGGDEVGLLNDKLLVNGGLRFSGGFLPDNFYYGIEPRIATRYSLSRNDAVKLSYSRMYQYMHRVASSTATLPTDMWYPVTKTIKPQRSDQIALGYQHLFSQPKIMASVEGYYKWMDNLIEYREGANLILNNDFEDELLQGRGNAYGFEFLVRRDFGRFNGWVGYTLAWSTRKFDEINRGERFFAKYDRRHDLSVVLNYEISKRIEFSAIWVFMTGSRITPQIGQYIVATPSFTGIDVVPVYADRNAVKLSPTHRLDLNLIIKPKPKEGRKFYGEWHIGCYNTYNRSAPYQITIEPSDEGLGYKYVQEGLFGFLPSFSYNFKF
ncbi:MAG: TonB-dependent receptor [Flavobacteriales bacterium]|nr:TonB-dependent receptor [Flavobacteriales bacterium]